MGQAAAEDPRAGDQRRDGRSHAEIPPGNREVFPDIGGRQRQGAVSMINLNRRQWLAAGALAALSARSAGRLLAAADNAPDTEKLAGELITPAAQAAIDRGLEYLASRQHEDGSFGSGGYSRNVAVCGLSGMAFMSA